MPSWKSPVAGNWSVPTNWQYNVIPAAVEKATFNASASVPATKVTLDIPASLTGVTLTDTTTGAGVWELAGTEVLTLTMDQTAVGAPGGGYTLVPQAPTIAFSDASGGVVKVGTPISTVAGLRFDAGSSVTSQILFTGDSTVQGAVDIDGWVRVGSGLTGRFSGVTSYRLMRSGSKLIFGRSENETLSVPVTEFSASGGTVVRKDGAGDLIIDAAQASYTGQYETGVVGGAIILKGDTDFTVSGRVVSSGVLRKIGAGTTTFNRPNYGTTIGAGEWRVEQGKLILTGGKATTGPVRVYSGAGIEVLARQTSLIVDEGAQPPVIRAALEAFASAVDFDLVGSSYVGETSLTLPRAANKTVSGRIGAGSTLGSGQYLSSTGAASTSATVIPADFAGAAVCLTLEGGGISSSAAGGITLAQADASFVYVGGSAGYIGSTIANMSVGSRGSKVSGGTAVIDLSGTASLNASTLAMGDSAKGATITLRGTGSNSIRGSAAALTMGSTSSTVTNSVAHTVLTLDGASLMVLGASATATKLVMKGNSSNARTIINVTNGGALTLSPGTLAADISGATPKIINLNNGGAYNGTEIPGVTIICHDGGFKLGTATYAQPIFTTAPVIASGMGVESVTFDGPGCTRGAGYIAPPHVRIVGGSGVGASARAEVNAAGEISNVVITGRGSGYLPTDTVEALFEDGRWTTCAVGKVNLSANTGLGDLYVKAGAYSVEMRPDFPFKGSLIIESGTYIVGGTYSVGTSWVAASTGTIGYNNASPVNLVAANSVLRWERTGDATLSQTISGLGGITKKAVYTKLILVGDNTFSGPITAESNSGAIRVESPTAFGSGTGLVWVKVGSSVGIASTLTSGNERPFKLNGAGVSVTGLSHAGALRVEATNTLSGQVALESDSTIVATDGATATFDSAVGFTGAFKLTLSGSATSAFNVDAPVKVSAVTVGRDTTAKFSKPATTAFNVDTGTNAAIIVDSADGTHRLGKGGTSRVTLFGTGSIKTLAGSTQRGRHTYTNLTLQGGRLIIGD